MHVYSRFNNLKRISSSYEQRHVIEFAETYLPSFQSTIGYSITAINIFKQALRTESI